MSADARFYFTPKTTQNGWWPKGSPNGRYLAFGNQQNYVVDLWSAAPVEQQIQQEGQVLGFMSDDVLYASERDINGTPTIYHFSLPDLTRQVAYVGPAAFGTEAHASLWHWATFPNGGYTVDAHPYVPNLPASGLSQDGEWISYQTIQNGRALPVVENVVTRASRIVDVDGINYARVFAGPGGGYLFYAAPDGTPWINLPDNTNVPAKLPNCSLGEGFGALAWRGSELWVWTYSYNPDGSYYALGRPYGAADAIQLAGIAANEKTMQVGQGPEGWTVAGMNSGALSAWVNVPYDAVRTPYGGSHLDGTVPPVEPPVPPVEPPAGEGRIITIAGPLKAGDVIKIV